MSINQNLVQNKTAGWRLGFANLFNKESGEWWRSRRWWIHLLLWVILIDGLLVTTLFGIQNIAAMSGETISDIELLDSVLKTLFGVATLSLALGIIIVTQDEFIGEKQNSTAAWILSKPASRSAFYLSKFTATLIPMVLVMILPPLVIGYSILSFSGFEINIFNYLISSGLLLLHTFFYLTLSLLFGVFFTNRTALLAGTLGILFGGQLLSGVIEFLTYIGPFVLPQMLPIITMEGPSFIPANLWIAPAVSFVWSILFIVSAIWRINRLEF